MHRTSFTPEQSVKMLRIRFPDLDSCLAALQTAAQLPDTLSRELLIEDLFIAFEVAGFDRNVITRTGLTHLAKEHPLTEATQETVMPRTKGSPNKTTATRKAKEKANTPFHLALKSAEALLAARRKELEEAQATARKLMVEIPNLELTISALNRQLNPSATPVLEGPIPIRPALTADPDGINEVKDGMGVVLSTTEEPAPEVAPDLDSIPGMGGQWS